MSAYSVQAAFCVSASSGTNPQRVDSMWTSAAAPEPPASLAKVLLHLQLHKVKFKNSPVVFPLRSCISAPGNGGCTVDRHYSHPRLCVSVVNWVFATRASRNDCRISTAAILSITAL